MSQDSAALVCISGKWAAQTRGQQVDLDIARQIDGELGGSEDMLGLGPLGQQVVWSHPPDEGTLA